MSFFFKFINNNLINNKHNGINSKISKENSLKKWGKAKMVNG